MKYRIFGRTDKHVSEIGFGAWAIGGVGGLNPMMILLLPLTNHLIWALTLLIPQKYMATEKVKQSSVKCFEAVIVKFMWQLKLPSCGQVATIALLQSRRSLP